ncbi:DNA-methyltransferase [Metamycoplasma auris]|uniref:Methyltransferase n=1 Tax=Metamycoplasma auris TaxID=51363 RepID=A0A2W7FWI5_9BACT|nr:site-specific DNA-methyltransferase [Metamycoplasma auris]PZV98739.1 site-specific DNA-methyltransferase (cytosine-N4-specific) [Metamycoplasma auris]
MKGIGKDKFDINIVHYHNSNNMYEIPDASIDLVITSPPYFNIKDYSKDGYQKHNHSNKNKENIGDINNFDEYILSLLLVWKECYRVLKPNGKMCINVPLMPMLKKDFNNHYNRHIYDLQSEIQSSILKNTNFFLLDLFIWNRTNSTKKLMFGSYPYPRNFYVQNTIEFITIFVKGGKPDNETINNEIKEKSKLSKEEWLEYTKQIWNIPIPNKKDLAFGEHSAIMPEEIANRLIKLYSFFGDVVLDPFAGSGTTLKKAYELGRNYIGYEIYLHYKKVIDKKINSVISKRGEGNEK